ncbi:MAG: hypothetical protein NTZ68_02740 [Candidatus Dependentiae bacterium]|nr:hypothetical protein [Candidatus Dependentiae bacterium]
MKKLNVLFAVTIGLLNAKADAGLMKVSYPLDQQGAKKETLFKDGVSFAQMEETARKNCPQIPDILLTDAMLCPLTGIDTGSDAAYLPSTQSIWASRTTADRHSSKAFEWAMLHETGHAQMPYAVNSIHGAVVATNLATAYYWGAHKAKPYKNRVTKYGSKYLAMTAAGAIVNSTLMKIEERRADNWANKTADAQALQGGIEYFEASKIKQQEEWSKYKLSSVVPFGVAKYLLDPIHPSLDSRIAKCKTVLKNRFSINA